jgi:hypothetical protein
MSVGAEVCGTTEFEVHRRVSAVFGVFVVVGLLALRAFASSSDALTKPFRKWSLDEAVEILNNSAWARQETYTRVVGGIGSGVLGEKEILETFFVRFVSARPIREAYARVQQIQSGYDRLSTEQKRRMDRSLVPVVRLDSSRWIVLAVSFRSNDESTERQVKQFFEIETTESMRPRAFLSTDRFPQVKLEAYFAPTDEALGAKFVFPRYVGGKPVVVKTDESVTFEIDVPGLERDLRARFAVAHMVIKGDLVL